MDYFYSKTGLRWGFGCAGVLYLVVALIVLIFGLASDDCGGRIYTWIIQRNGAGTDDFDWKTPIIEHVFANQITIDIWFVVAALLSGVLLLFVAIVSSLYDSVWADAMIKYERFFWIRAGLTWPLVFVGVTYGQGYGDAFGIAGIALLTALFAFTQAYNSGSNSASVTTGRTDIGKKPMRWSGWVVATGIYVYFAVVWIYYQATSSSNAGTTDAAALFSLIWVLAIVLILHLVILLFLTNGVFASTYNPGVSREWWFLAADALIILGPLIAFFADMDGAGDCY